MDTQILTISAPADFLKLWLWLTSLLPSLAELERAHKTAVTPTKHIFLRSKHSTLPLFVQRNVKRHYEANIKRDLHILEKDNRGAERKS